MSQWETTAGLSRSYLVEPTMAAQAVVNFFHKMAFEIVLIGVEEARLAVEASHRYGRGRHPAALNMGDCFSYACAKSSGARLLYKGNDFAKTDLA